MEVLEMHRRFLVFSTVVTAAIVVFLWAPVSVAAQAQSREEVQEAARKVSPHSAEGAAEYWNEEVEAKIAAAVASVYDPAKPPTANPPRTPWGDPDLRGYYLTTSYTPLQRPQGVDKALYTHEEAINAFTRRSVEDSGVDPATVHYDWKEFGMDRGRARFVPACGRDSSWIRPMDEFLRSPQRHKSGEPRRQHVQRPRTRRPACRSLATRTRAACSETRWRRSGREA
jgi:hypothetical protein